jgi:hypothetical protein
MKNQAVSIFIAHKLLKNKENIENGSRPILAIPKYLLHGNYVPKSMSIKQIKLEGRRKR